MTFERRLEDNPTVNCYYPIVSMGPIPSVRHCEGVFLGYRYYTTQRKPTLFPFGFGMTYTTFRLDSLNILSNGDVHNPHLRVSFDVTNTGGVTGTEVAQVYISSPPSRVPRPLRELKGFRKVRLRAGESQHVSIELDPRAFVYFDVNSGSWKTEAGQYMVQVGTSSESIVLQKPTFLH
jgi:beta-glucosidase